MTILIGMIIVLLSSTEQPAIDNYINLEGRTSTTNVIPTNNNLTETEIKEQHSSLKKAAKQKMELNLYDSVSVLALMEKQENLHNLLAYLQLMMKESLPTMYINPKKNKQNNI